VTRRVGVRRETYELWIQERDELNATAAAGHIVGVTQQAFRQLPNGQLAAVLAHELGHHVSGHTWAGMLTFWYALPARTVWGLVRGILSRLLRESEGGGLACGGCLVLVLGGFVVSLLASLTGVHPRHGAKRPPHRSLAVSRRRQGQVPAHKPRRR
jgi:Zn-dependent protease with chaperone function